MNNVGFSLPGVIFSAYNIRTVMLDSLNNNLTLRKYFGIIPGLLALAIYLTTTCRSIWIGDSGEFSLAFKTLGICHPPGYPLITLLGKTFLSITPYIRPTFAANLLNVIVSAAVVTVLYYFIRRYLSLLSSTILSLIWAFNPLFWAETAGIEVYNLNLLLILLTFYTIESNHNRKWLIAIYLIGLALANHPLAMAFLPVLLYKFMKEKIYKHRDLLMYMVIILGITGSIYLYLPIRASCNPISNWGNPSSFNALIKHMTLSQYGGWIVHSWDNLAMSGRLFFISLVKSWWILGTVFVIIGAGYGIIKKRVITLSAILIISACVLLASSHMTPNFEPFYLPAMFAALLLIANNLIWFESRKLSSLVRYSVYTAGFIVALVMLISNYKDNDKSDYTLSEDYSKHILDSADNGILFTAGDINSFATLYLRYAEGYRPDVEVFDRSIRLKALIDTASQLSGQAVYDYYNAREAVIAFADGMKYLAKSHYIYEPSWLNTTKPLYSHGILYTVNDKPDRDIEILKYPIGYRPGDVLSRQLLVNLDLV